ncbi:MAG: Ribonuclease toxin, BrnT, of type II toxin-antitoxin system [uncultured Campylobacterales bacterium]|uniref:Ribonuclease toxin, BrnT, of type II toxin-antitoxin system n=1 Tax=uncultured Campylobacterales bacterium TaxID=352960 RepID=A0A6S6SKZ8_9BACT|nr:MAG: Ribonuclease toxin, BrnT, of type II toxin-antitoxin system [uncultured Campylobacterales bacterium]
MDLKDIYLFKSKKINWNEEKNKLLKETRNISFEEVLNLIENKNILSIEENPSSNFNNQKCFVLKLKDYIYLVPFVETENEVFLKTIIPSRKYKNIYLDKD